MLGRISRRIAPILITKIQHELYSTNMNSRFYEACMHACMYYFRILKISERNVY